MNSIGAAINSNELQSVLVRRRFRMEREEMCHPNHAYTAKDNAKDVCLFNTLLHKVRITGINNKVLKELAAASRFLLFSCL